MQEGVTKFHARHQDRRLDAGRYGALAASLIGWREVLARLGGVGQDPQRYDGAGYGNLSARVGPFPGAPGARAFLVTGTQTGGRSSLNLDDLCVVRRYDLAANRVDSEGAARPSSESLTHGAIYDLGPHLRFVFHVHCRAPWRARRALRLPTTAPTVPYGTPEMAREVLRLARETPLLERRVLAMAGHEDGIIAFGRTADEAGTALITTLAAAYAHPGARSPNQRTE